MMSDVLESLTDVHHDLKNHELTRSLNSHQAVKRFMMCHVYSVWDFMNLLKYLQSAFTCLTVPWKPSQLPKLARLINEIVLEEESDLIDGQATSHFSYYVKALQLVNPESKATQLFLNDLNSGLSMEALMSQSYIPKPAQVFLKRNARVFNQSDLAVATVFAFGRETLVPRLFEPIVTQLKALSDTKYDAFTRYLERHIELDGEQHSVLALALVEALIRSPDDWELVKAGALEACHARLAFWDDIVAFIKT